MYRVGGFGEQTGPERELLRPLFPSSALDMFLDNLLFCNTLAGVLFVLYSRVLLWGFIVWVGLHVNDRVGNLKRKELLIHIEGPARGGIQGAGSFLELGRYDGKGIFVADNDRAFVDVYVHRKQLEKCRKAVLLRPGGGRVTRIDAQVVSFFFRWVFPQLVVALVVIMARVRRGCATGSVRGGGLLGR